jgi:hypothetical protein
MERKLFAEGMERRCRADDERPQRLSSRSRAVRSSDDGDGREKRQSNRRHADERLQDERCTDDRDDGEECAPGDEAGDAPRSEEASPASRLPLGPRLDVAVRATLTAAATVVTACGDEPLAPSTVRSGRPAPVQSHRALESPSPDSE